MDTKKIIADFAMSPHIEGGHYKELWQSADTTRGRCLTSLIHYLLQQGERCKWHRLTSDELWLFHRGAELTMVLGGSGDAPQEERRIDIGKERFHLVVPAGTWQSALAQKGDVLVSCVVSPGYDSKDCEIYQGEAL